MGDHAPPVWVRKGGWRERQAEGEAPRVRSLSPQPRGESRAGAGSTGGFGLNRTFMSAALAWGIGGRRPAMLGYEWGPSAVSFSFNLSFVLSFNTRPGRRRRNAGLPRDALWPGGPREENPLCPSPGLGCSVGPLQARRMGTAWAEVAPGRGGLLRPRRLPPARPLPSATLAPNPGERHHHPGSCGHSHCSHGHGTGVSGLLSQPLGLMGPVVFGVRRSGFPPARGVERKGPSLLDANVWTGRRASASGEAPGPRRDLRGATWAQEGRAWL